MAYAVEHLDTIARCARIIRNYVVLTPDQAIDQALDTLASDCNDIIKGKRPSMTAEQVDGYRWLAGVINDVRNGFVSPTIGNVRDYVKAEVSK